ncbi:large ribosomal subunit protein bL12m-like isoform X1 [Lytechinus pictus]
MNNPASNLRPIFRLLTFGIRLSRHANEVQIPVTTRIRLHHSSRPVINPPKVTACTRQYSSGAIPAPSRDNEPKQYPEKISSLVDQIAALTLSEVSDLNELLKKTLNIQDAPMMAVGAAPAVAAAPAEQDDDEGDVVKAPEKTQFTVKLNKFDEASKVKIIKAIKALTSGMNLVQAKKFVESAPQVVKADVGKTEAEEIKKQLEEAGGTCEIE